MNTVLGLTGIGVVTFVLFASSVTVKLDPVEYRRAEVQRRSVQRYAELYGLDAKELESDGTFLRMLSSRAGPHHHLAELRKKKAEAVVKGE